MQIGWLTAVLDLPTAAHRAGVKFWCAVTGGRVSPRRGDRGQFRTAVPPDGEAMLRFRERGHAVEQEPPSEVRVQRSPGGVAYRLVPLTASRRRPPANRCTAPGAAWPASSTGSAWTSRPRCTR